MDCMDDKALFDLKSAILDPVLMPYGWRKFSDSYNPYYLYDLGYYGKVSIFIKADNNSIVVSTEDGRPLRSISINDPDYKRKLMAVMYELGIQ